MQDKNKTTSKLFMNQFKKKQQKLMSTLVKVIKNLKLYETPHELFTNLNEFLSEQTDNSLENLSSRQRSTGVSDLKTSLELLDPDDSTQKSQVWGGKSRRLTFPKNSNSRIENSESFIDHLLEEDPDNLYFRFLKEVRVQNDPPNTRNPVHFHHIIPKYLFKKTSQPFYDRPFNLIVLTIEDHKKAHEILFELYGDPRDFGAVLLLGNQVSEAVRVWRQQGARATHRLLKAQKRIMFDPTWQTEMGRRSLAKPDALETRSQGGKVGGRKRNLNRVIKLEDRYLFYRDGQEFLCIFNCETGGDVLKELNKAFPTKLQRATQLLTGTRARLHGWSCKKLTEA